jgi:hypothetical protein
MTTAELAQHGLPPIGLFIWEKVYAKCDRGVNEITEAKAVQAAPVYSRLPAWAWLSARHG